MNILRVIVPGEPVPAARPRLAIRKDSWGNAYARKPYTPGRYAAYLERVAVCARAAAAKQGWDDCEVDFRVSISVHQTQRRGDLDNYVKAILDGLTRAGNVWDDDRLVDDVRAVRVVGGNPHVAIVVAALPASEPARRIATAKGRKHAP